jgi:hypothetical protein
MAAKTSKARPKNRGRTANAAAGKATDAGDLRVLARDAALAALKRLSVLSRSEDERVALAATQELLNRAFGKASATGTEEMPATQPLIIKIVKFGGSDETRPKGGRQS